MKKIIFIVATSLVMLSCTNKNLEDFRKSKFDEAIQRYNSIAGIYRARTPMLSKFDKAPMGYIQLILTPKSKSSESPDGTSTEMRPFLTGSITHIDKTSTQITFESGSYDYDTGTIVITVPVGDQKIQIYGVISNDKKTIATTIQAEGGDPRFGGNVSLEKDAPLVTVTDTGNPDPDVVQYTGIFNYPKHDDGDRHRPTTVKIIMSISTPTVDPKFRFYNLLVPTKEVDIGLLYVFDNGMSYRLNTPKGHIDSQFRTLNAVFETGGTTDTFKNSLACLGMENDQWNCVITHLPLGQSKGVLTRVQ